MKKPTARRSTMYSINQAAITMCNQAGGKLYPPLKDAESVYGNVAISHVGVANIGGHPTYYGNPQVRKTFVPPPQPTVTQEVRVGGVALALNSTPLVTSLANFMPLQRWTSAKRASLKPSGYEAFHKSMTANILGKGNKLETMVIKVNSPQLLKSVKNLQGQLEAISSHLHSHDCAQVMTIFIPVNIYATSEVSPTTYDLMRDYAVLPEAVVANSTTWINMWVASKAIRENIQLVFEFLRNNVHPELWAKALEEYQDFSGVQQGGPLMFYLVMRRILDISEASILALVSHMKAIKINKIVGEDIEEAVSTIKATIKVLVQCSTDVRNFV
ncbi:MAG: hypothetical protein ACRCZI_08030, partial [Cetobacterium sp.]